MQRNKQNIKRFILTAILLGTGYVYAQDTTQKINQFSLAQALDYAKQHSVQVKNALIDVRIQQQVNRDVTSIALPQISATGSVTKNFDIPVQTIPNFIAPATYGVLVNEGVVNGTGQAIQLPSADQFGNLLFPFGNPWSANAGVTLSQILFDGQVFVALKARNGTIEFQEKRAALTEENVRENIYKVYYQLVIGKIQMGLLDANIERLEKLSRDTKIIYENGFAEKLDVDKITVQIVNLQTEKLKANTMIGNGNAGLKVLLGMPFKEELILTDTLSDDKLKEGVLEAGEFNYKDRRDFQVSEITNVLNALNVRRYKLGQLPSLSLVGGYSKQAQRTEFDFFKKRQWFTASYVGLQLQVPIFYGFSLRSKTEKARLELQQSKNNTEALKIQIDEEVASSKINFTTAIATMDYQKRNMALAEQVYNQTKKKYEIGTGSSTEINTAQIELKTAQTNYITALYDAIIARVDFFKATGKL